MCCDTASNKSSVLDFMAVVAEAYFGRILPKLCSTAHGIQDTLIE